MIVRALAEVFSKVRYILLAATLALVTFVLTTWAGNLGLVWQVATSEGLQLADKAKIILALIGSIATNFTAFSAATTIGIAILFGVNVAMTIFDFRRRRMMAVQSGAAAVGLGGLVAGLFGIGCAACGSFLFSPALAFLGAGTLVSLLPFGGEEFGALGLGMLVLSLVLLARRTSQPLICEVSANAKLPPPILERSRSPRMTTSNS